MSFSVELSPTAEADLERLFEFLIDRAETTEAAGLTPEREAELLAKWHGGG